MTIAHFISYAPIHSELTPCTRNRDPKTHQNPLPAHLGQWVLEDLIRKRRKNINLQKKIKKPQCSTIKKVASKNAPTTSKRKVESGKRFLSGTSDVDVPSLKFFHWSYYPEVHWNIHRNKIVKGFIENQMDSEEHSYFLKINGKRAIHCRPRVEERIISKYSLVNRRKKPQMWR